MSWILTSPGDLADWQVIEKHHPIHKPLGFNKIFWRAIWLDIDLSYEFVFNHDFDNWVDVC